MKRAIHHQSYNTNQMLLTTYRYDHTSNPGPIGVPHFHKNYEILVPMIGSTQVTIEGRVYVIQPGEAVLVHPFQIHSLHIAQRSYLWCSVFSAQLVGTLHPMLEGTKPRHPVFRPSEGVTRFFLEEMMRYFDTWRGWRTLTNLQKLAVKSSLYAMGSEYLGQVELLPDGGTRSAENMAVGVTRYIAEHFKNGITLQDVAKELGYNYQYLSKSFHLLFGINFKKLLNQYRMEHAMTLLLESKMPVTQIAFESGFQSLRTFNYVCRETFGKSPSEIRGGM